MTRISSIVTGCLHCALICHVLMGKTIYQTKENVLFYVNIPFKVLSKNETHLGNSHYLAGEGAGKF